ncbi:MAG: peroxidase, partial [Candidatus Eremiobacteraeota bacterium]|nr:peroxidase [Candidatus Eremiobacteraeota bacterium]
MSTPQMGIFSLGDGSHSFIEFALRGSPPANDVVVAVASMHDQRKTTDAVNLVVGFRPELWRAAAPADAPA